MQEFEEKIGLLKNEKIDFQNKISEKDNMVDQIKTENMLMIKQMEDQINILNIDNIEKDKNIEELKINLASEIKCKEEVQSNYFKEIQKNNQVLLEIETYIQTISDLKKEKKLTALLSFQIFFYGTQM